MKLKYFIVLAVVAMMTACNSSDRYGKDVDTVDVETGDSIDNPVIDESTQIVDSTETKKDSVPSLEVPPRRDMTYDAVMKRMRTSGHWAEYQQGIIPQMASDCLEYADRLLNNTHQYFIVVDKASMNVILYDKYGREVKAYRTACSKYYGTKHKKADNRTPEGFFVAQGIYDSTDWLYTNDWGVTSQARGQFGPRFIRLKTPVTSQVGIHGTASPGSLGRRVSHGCIRIANPNILELVKYAKPGMPIIVNPSTTDMAVNKKEGYNIPRIVTGYSGPVPNSAEIEAAMKEAARSQAASERAARAAAAAASAKKDTSVAAGDTTKTAKPAKASSDSVAKKPRVKKESADSTKN